MTALADPALALTETQLRVIGLLAGGSSNARIAVELGISPATVKWNVSEILSKLGVANRTEAGDWWRARHGVRRKLWRESVGDSGDEAADVYGAKVYTGGTTNGFQASGESLAIEEWRGSAPGELHVHHANDIAWHVIEGTLRFRFAGGETAVAAGSTLFVPAGTAHTYGEGDARYLVIGHPRLFELFRELRAARTGRPHTDWGSGPDTEIYRKYGSELLDRGPRT